MSDHPVTGSHLGILALADPPGLVYLFFTPAFLAFIWLLAAGIPGSVVIGCMVWCSSEPHTDRWGWSLVARWPMPSFSACNRPLFSVNFESSSRARFLRFVDFFWVFFLCSLRSFDWCRSRRRRRRDCWVLSFARSLKVVVGVCLLLHACRCRSYVTPYRFAYMHIQKKVKKKKKTKAIPYLTYI